MNCLDCGNKMVIGVRTWYCRTCGLVYEPGNYSSTYAASWYYRNGVGTVSKFWCAPYGCLVVLRDETV